MIQTPTGAKDVQKVGYVGVALFFLLSGFILAYNYLGPVDRGELRKGAFWRARFARIYPLYFVALLLTIPSGFSGESSGVVIRLNLLQAWIPSIVGEWNLPSWSLSAEAFFYLIFPFVLPLIAKIPTKWLVPAALGCVFLAVLPGGAWLAFRSPGLRTAVNNFSLETSILKFNPLIRLPDFLAGATLGVAYLRLSWAEKLSGRPWLRRGILLASLAGLTLLIESRQKVPWELLHNGLFLIPFGLLLVALAPGKGTLASLMSYRVPVFLGEASYAMYLLHTPLYEMLRKNALLQPFATDHKVLFPVYFLVLVLVSSLLHLAVERPARRWLTRVSSR